MTTKQTEKPSVGAMKAAKKIAEWRETDPRNIAYCGEWEQQERDILDYDEKRARIIDAETGLAKLLADLEGEAETLEAIADELLEFHHSARADSLRVIAKRLRRSSVE